jgi:hypothetical protein
MADAERPSVCASPCECQRRAQEEVKARIPRQGKVKLSTIPPREIVAMAG